MRGRSRSPTRTRSQGPTLNVRRLRGVTDGRAQKLPDDYNVGNQVATIARLGGEIGSSATCLDARGVPANEQAHLPGKSDMRNVTVRWTLGL